MFDHVIYRDNVRGIQERLVWAIYLFITLQHECNTESRHIFI